MSWFVDVLILLVLLKGCYSGWQLLRKSGSLQRQYQTSSIEERAQMDRQMETDHELRANLKPLPIWQVLMYLGLAVAGAIALGYWRGI